MSNREIIIPILNEEYKVVVCWGTSEFVNKVAVGWQYPKGDVEIDEETMRGATFNHSGCNPIIVLRGYPESPDEIGTLAHEAVHAINNIYEKVSEDRVDGEIFAHSVAAVVRGVLSRQGWKRKPKRKKIK